MRRIVFLAALLLSLQPASAQTVAVSGNVYQITGSAASGTTVVFELQNYGGNIPKVSGTAILGDVKKTFTPASGTGAFSGTVYGNDVITPSGTFYRICIFLSGVRFRCNDYSVTGGSFNLNTAAPLTTAPTVSADTANSTYLRLDGGNGPPKFVGPEYHVGWFTSGYVTAPSAAPVVAVESATGGTIAANTYYCVYTLGNKNGETTASPQASVVTTGATSQIRLNTNSQEWLTGAYKMRVYCGTASGGPYYLQTPKTLSYTVSAAGNTRTVSTINRVSNIVTLVTTAAHGFAVNDLIYVSGVTDTSFNGVFVVSSVPNSTAVQYVQIAANASDTTGTVIQNPSAVRFNNKAYLRFGSAIPFAKYDTVTVASVTDATFNGSVEVNGLGATSRWFSYANTGADGTSTNGTVTQFTGIDTNWHYIASASGRHNDVILDAITLSGSNPPSTNTATIDPLQVAVNTARVASTGNDSQQPKGIVMLKANAALGAAAYTLTTPLILGFNSPTIQGVGSGLNLTVAGTGTTITAGWSADPNVGVVMCMARGCTIKNVDINGGTVSNALMLVGGSHDMNAQYGEGVYLRVGSATTNIAPFRVHRLSFSDTWQFEGINMDGGRFCGWYSSHVGTSTRIRLANGRINCGSPTTASAVVHAAGAPDFDRGSLNTSDSTPAAIDLEMFNIVPEVAKGICYDFGGGAIRLTGSSENADSSPAAGTEAALKYWVDNWSTGAGIQIIEVGPLAKLYQHTNYSTTIKVESGNVRLDIQGKVATSANGTLDMNYTSMAKGSLFGGDFGSNASTQVINIRQISSSLEPPSSGWTSTFLRTPWGVDAFTQTRYASSFPDRIIIRDAYKNHRRRTFQMDFTTPADTFQILGKDDTTVHGEIQTDGNWRVAKWNSIKIVDGTVYPTSMAGIASAISDVAAGGTVYLPPATYAGTTTISIGKKVSIVCARGAVIAYTGTGNAISFGASSDYSTISDCKITGGASSVHGISVTSSQQGRIARVDVQDFKTGAGIYLGQGSISWSVDNAYAQGNLIGYKVESTTPFNSNNHVFIGARAVNNHDASNIGTQFQCIGGQSILFDGILSNVTNTNTTVEGIDIRGCLSVMVVEPYIEHVNSGKAVVVKANGSTLSQDVRIIGGTWQAGNGTSGFQISLEGDRRTQILDPQIGLRDETYNDGATDISPKIVLSTSTHDPVLRGNSLWKMRLTDNGAFNPTLDEEPRRYVRSGGLYETEAKTNLLPNSEALNLWNTSANVTVTANATTAPDGTSTADKVEKTGGSGNEYVSHPAFSTSTAKQTCSVWLRADTPRRSDILIVEQGVGNRSIRRVSVSAGWRRFILPQDTAGAGGNLDFRIRPVSDVDGAATGFIYAWGGQCEAGNVSDYIPTSGGTVARARGFSSSKDGTFYGRVAAKRLFANGTALVAGDYALHANWGTGATVTAVTGTDQAWDITVTAAGTPGANPTITFTFKDGTWTNAPICISKMTGGTGTITDLSDSTTATTWTITFNGTPVAASTYKITGICVGR